MNQLIKNSKLLSCVTVAAGAAGSSAITGSTLDLANAEGVLIIAQTGPIVSGATTSIKFQHGDLSDMSDAADVEGTSQTIADDDDNEIFYLEIRKPVKRYGRLYVSRATQNATIAAAALVYGQRSAPITQATGVNGEVAVSPASGTA